MIAHRLKTVRHANQILVVDHGRIVQHGTHDQLIQQKGIYADFILNRKAAIDWKITHSAGRRRCEYKKISTPKNFYNFF